MMRPIGSVYVVVFGRLLLDTSDVIYQNMTATECKYYMICAGCTFRDTICD